MSLLDEASATPVRTNLCWAAQLPDDLSAELAEVEDAHDRGQYINQAALVRALKARGVGKTSDVGRHLRHECKCRS